MYNVIKILTSALLIFAISEIAKRSSFWGAILASLPLVSIIAFIFLYEESKDLTKVSELSISIFWLVIPSLALFLVLSYCIKKGMSFYPSLAISIGITIILYFGMSLILKRLGVL